MRTRVKLIVVLLIAGVFLSVTGFAINTAEAHRRQQVTMSTHPSPFPSVVLGTLFEFGVMVTNTNRHTLKVFLTLEADCPEGGEAGLSGDAEGDACGGPLETHPIKIKRGRSATWEFSVIYLGSVGTYDWTITAFKYVDDDDDD